MHSAHRAGWLTLALPLLAAEPASAHVKWFAPYIVGAPPQPIGATLANTWFWVGIALVLVFFLATRAIERSSAGERILLGMDRLPIPYGTVSTISCVAWSAPFSSPSLRSAAST